jgi:hypothetical protein
MSRLPRIGAKMLNVYGRNTLHREAIFGRLSGCQEVGSFFGRFGNVSLYLSKMRMSLSGLNKGGSEERRGRTASERHVTNDLWKDGRATHRRGPVAGCMLTH